MDNEIQIQLRKLESRLASYMERIHSYLIFMSQIPGFQNIPDIDKNAMASGESQSLNTSQIKKHFKSGYQNFRWPTLIGDWVQNKLISWNRAFCHIFFG